MRRIAWRAPSRGCWRGPSRRWAWGRRGREAITDLSRTVLTPLEAARGGAAPLLATLAAYFSHGGVAAAAARDLHLSVRAVTYRLARVRDLTGRDPTVPADALTLQVAVIGARLLDWPATPLPAG